MRSYGSPWPTVLGVGAILLALRYVALGATDLSLHGDEAQYWTWSRDLAFGYYSKPPLIAWVIAASTAICGDAAWCIRAPAALFHIGTACWLTATAGLLYNRRVALWAGIGWLTVPAVSYSSLIMSTDAILLFFWAGCLWAYCRLMQRSDWGSAAVLALCFGLGLNAKYAMAYFLLCLIAHLAVSGSARDLIRRNLVKILVGFGAGAAMLLPNVLWNRQHDWATIGHTADNANWQGLVLHFDEMAEFLGSQFGVFGPIFFAVLLLAIPRSRAMAKVLPEQARLLLAFSLPILLIVTGQALLSRANANWAATAYPAATILIASALLESARRRIWLVGSLGLHLAVALVVYVAIQFPGPVARVLGKDPFRDVLGWDAVASDVSAAMDAADTAILLMDNRLMMASMAYALRDRPDLVIRSWNHDTKIDHHYEMAWLYDPGRDGGRVLLLTHHGTEGIAADFDAVEMLPDITRTDQTGRERRIEMRLLERLK